MKDKVYAAFLILLLMPATALSQGFAGMGQSADGFAMPDPETRLSFPADHGPHPDFRIEWWYLTANLTGDDGRDYGIQWTLFRSATASGDDTQSGWNSPQLWMGHAAVTTPDAHHSTERFARNGIGQAGVEASPFHAWIDEWSMQGLSLKNVNVTAQGTDFGYDLSFDAQGPFILQGEQGFSVKSEAGQASHYYSQPFYEVSGKLMLPDGEVSVTGSGWLDREWSSQPLTADQTGWDWVSLHFDDGAKLMGYRLRDASGGAYAVGTWIEPDGETFPFPNGVLQAEPLVITDVDGREVPTSWRIALPARGVDVEIHAVNPQSWMDTTVAYWEGPVRITGSHTGRGYLEMTGYD